MAIKGVPSLLNRHHLVLPSAAWRPLTIASPRTIPSCNAANSVSVLLFCPILLNFAFTTPNDSAPLSLDLDFAHGSVLWSSPRYLYRTDFQPSHVDQCDLLHAQGITGRTFSLPARHSHISRYVQWVISLPACSRRWTDCVSVWENYSA